MTLAQHIQNAWQRQAKWLILLRPLSWLYRAVFVLHRAYSKQFKTPYRAPIPVMVIGNITVGGSGKTPLLISLVRYLQSQHIQVGVISRGYGGIGPFPALVQATSQACCVGDEPCMIAQLTQVPMAVGANREANIELLLQHYALDLIISDDGLQHWALARDIEWIVLDLNRGLGNKQLLPEGFLREPVSRLKQATVIEHCAQPHSPLFMQLQIGQPYLLFKQNIVNFDRKQRFHAVVGIGYPSRFFQSLTDSGVLDIIPHVFADHHDYRLEDVAFNDNLPIITTEKDAVKLKGLWGNASNMPQIWVLPVEAELSPACYTLLNQQLHAQGISLVQEPSL